MASIRRLEIHNFVGIQDLALDLGPRTEITGGNGAGKSSILEAIEWLYTNEGRRVHQVRDGEDRTEVLVELDDEAGTLIERRVRDGEAGKVTVKQGRATLSSPQGFLNDLFGSGLIFNPVTFLDLPLEKQTAVLLDLVELDLPTEELRALCDGKVPVEYVAGQTHPLKAVKLGLDELSAQRTEIGREQKRHEGAAETAKAKVPQGFDAGAARAQSVTEISERLSQANTHNADRDRRAATVSRLEIDAQHQRNEIADLEERVERAKQALFVTQAEIGAQERWLEENPAQDTSALESQLATYDTEQATLKSFDEAGEETQAAREAKAEWDRLTSLIEALRAKPQQLLAAAHPPIEGMGVEDGAVTINGRPLADHSDGERLDLAVQIAEALAGELKLVLVDGAEALDPERLEMMLTRLEAKGFHAVVARRVDGPLKVNGVAVAEGVA